MARSLLRRSMRKVFRGSSWLTSVGRYRATFSRIFRAGKWRPDQEGSVWMGLFGIKASPLSLVDRRRRDRNKMARLLRLEVLETKQLLAADVFVKLSVGDGLVSQIPALIVSLAAGLLVTRGGNAGSTDQAVVNQLSGYPRALMVSAVLMAVLALMPGLPLVPFMALGGIMAFGSWFIPRQVEAENRAKREQEEKTEEVVALGRQIVAQAKPEDVKAAIEYSRATGIPLMDTADNAR